MSFFDTQNPGIGGLNELTTDEELFVQNISELPFEQGDILYHNGTSLTRLAAGTNGYFLMTQGPGANPIWDEVVGGSGTVDGSGTTNEITYWVDSDTLGALAVATYPSLAELAHVKGVTSALQTQLDGKQALDSDLTTIAGLTATTDNFIVSVSSAWASRTPTQVKTTLSLNNVDNTSNATERAASATLTNKTLSGPTVQAGYFDLDIPASDHSVVGPATNAINSGYSSAAFDLVYLGTGGKWLEVDADAVATCNGLLGIAMEAKTDTQAMLVALPGSFVRDDTWNWTVGATLYAGETLGAMQETIPTGADAIIKVVGFAVSADVIFFNPSPDQQSTVA